MGNKRVRSTVIDKMCEVVLETEAVCCADLLGLMTTDCTCQCSSYKDEDVVVEVNDESSWYVHLPHSSSVYLALCPVPVRLTLMYGDAIEITGNVKLEDEPLDIVEYLPFAIHANKKSLILITTLN